MTTHRVQDGPCSATNPPPCYIVGDLPATFNATPVPALDGGAFVMLAALLIGVAARQIRRQR